MTVLVRPGEYCWHKAMGEFLERVEPPDFIDLSPRYMFTALHLSDRNFMQYPLFLLVSGTLDKDGAIRGFFQGEVRPESYLNPSELFIHALYVEKGWRKYTHLLNEAVHNFCGENSIRRMSAHVEEESNQKLFCSKYGFSEICRVLRKEL